MASQLSAINIKMNEKFVPLSDMVYPVGSFYFSMQSDSPASLFGGTWVSVEPGSFLMASATTEDSGATGGAAAITHSHWMPLGREGWDTGQLSYTTANGNQTPDVRGIEHLAHAIFLYGMNFKTEDTANATEQRTYDTTLNNLPPYFTCYMWYRTA